MAELQSYVHVADEEGRHGVFGPGDEVPDWAAARVTNPKAWVDGVRPAVAEPEPSDPGESGQSDADGLVEPPRSGKGSGLDAWRAYAEKLEWFDEIPADATREDIIASIDAERAEREKKTGE